MAGSSAVWLGLLSCLACAPSIHDLTKQLLVPTKSFRLQIDLCTNTDNAGGSTWLKLESPLYFICWAILGIQVTRSGVGIFIAMSAAPSTILLPIHFTPLKLRRMTAWVHVWFFPFASNLFGFQYRLYPQLPLPSATGGGCCLPPKVSYPLDTLRFAVSYHSHSPHHFLHMPPTLRLPQPPIIT